MTFDREQAERLIPIAEQLRAALDEIERLKALASEFEDARHHTAMSLIAAETQRDEARIRLRTAIAERDAARAELARVMPVYEAALQWRDARKADLFDSDDDSPEAIAADKHRRKCLEALAHATDARATATKERADG